MSQKCNEKCEVYSRVCGYFRPVTSWNHGKKEEFKDRKTYAVKAVRVSTLSILSILSILITGCKSTEIIAQGITTKNTTGNGTVVDSRIGIDPDTKIPGIKTVFVSGDFATVKAGTNQVSYREESSASIWNASSITKKRFLSITLTNTGNVPDTIKAVAEVFKTAETKITAEQPKTAEVKTAETQKTQQK